MDCWVLGATYLLTYLLTYGTRTHYRPFGLTAHMLAAGIAMHIERNCWSGSGRMGLCRPTVLSGAGLPHARAGLYIRRIDSAACGGARYPTVG